MTSLQQLEFRVLRETIAWRGTVRMALLPVTAIGWAIVAMLAADATASTLAALLSLGVLVAGFEAVHALHVGVERIGRYVQVFYEENGTGASWEQTAMRLGPGLPGAGIDPLFSVPFIAAALVNVTLAFPPVDAADVLGLAFVLAAHLAFALRVLRARRAAARQRAVDLETFTAIRAQLGRPSIAATSESRDALR